MSRFRLCPTALNCSAKYKNIHHAVHLSSSLALPPSRYSCGTHHRSNRTRFPKILGRRQVLSHRSSGKVRRPRSAALRRRTDPLAGSGRKWRDGVLQTAQLSSCSITQHNNIQGIELKDIIVTLPEKGHCCPQQNVRQYSVTELKVGLSQGLGDEKLQQFEPITIDLLQWRLHIRQSHCGSSCV